MKDKIISLLMNFDPEIIDALTFKEIVYTHTYSVLIKAETRERIMDVMMILMKNDEENEEFLNKCWLKLNTSNNEITIIL
jgi:hypothetical protein